MPFGASAEARVRSVWARRYLCRSCERTSTVLPFGVIRRYLYTAWAVVVAWFLVADEKVGEECDHAEAYKRQGMYARPEWMDASGYRWRSISRWKAALSRRWDIPGIGDRSWLLEVGQRSPSPDPAMLVRVAVAHVGCGSGGLRGVETTAHLRRAAC